MKPQLRQLRPRGTLRSGTMAKNAAASQEKPREILFSAQWRIFQRELTNPFIRIYSRR